MIEYITIILTIIAATGFLILALEDISNKHVGFGIKSMILYFWISSFLPFLLVPLDFSFFRSPPESKLALDVLWKVYYFLNLINGQILLPFLIAYVGSGYVIPKDRLLASSWEVLFWLGLKLIGLVFSIAIGLAIAFYGFKVQVDAFDFLKVNAINWLNTSLTD